MKNFIFLLMFISNMALANGINYHCNNYSGYSVCEAGNEKTFVVNTLDSFKAKTILFSTQAKSFCQEGYKVRTLLANNNNSINYKCDNSVFSTEIEQGEYTDWCATDTLDKTFFNVLRNVCKPEKF